MSETIDAEMLELFQAELKLCKVAPGQVVAVLSGGTVRGDYAQAILVAAQNLGAVAFHVNIRNQTNATGVVGKTPLANNRPAIEALKAADLVVDLLGLLFSSEQLEITNAGARMLLVLEPFHVLKKMFPNEDLRRRVEFGGNLLRKAREIRITSRAGTDIRYGLSQYPVITEYGYTDEPGRWDHLPSGFLFTQGNDGEVEGTVVLSPGDIVTAFRRYIQSPVKMTVRAGYVTKIEGDGMDAALISSHLESFNDPRGYAISHIGWGLNERASWSHMAETRHLDIERTMNALSYYGNVLFSTGPNTELGGTNDTPCHLDMPLRGCSLLLDGQPILDSGNVVPAEMRAANR